MGLTRRAASRCSRQLELLHRSPTSLHVPGHTHLTTVGQELNRLAPSSCCRHRRPMGVRGRRAPTAQPSRVGKALPLFFGGTVARRLADRNPLTTTWSSSPDERLMVKLPISTCPLSTSLGRFDWRWRLLLTSGIICPQQAFDQNPNFPTPVEAALGSEDNSLSWTHPSTRSGEEPCSHPNCLDLSCK